MLIDIDIKIADNDGNLVHHFEKRLDDEDAACLKKLNNNYSGESFEDFLSEYLSSSGHQVKEKLNSGSPASTRPVSAIPFEGTGSLKSEGVYNLDDSEIEYKIKIGNKDIFIGKMPLAQASTTVANKENPVELEKETQNTTFSAPELASLDNVFNNTMLKVIAKYEANLYPISIDEDSECQAFICQESESAKSELF